MADSRTTKIVEYRLQGNTVDLEKKLKDAIATLDTLDQKLTKISSATATDGRVKQSLGRASTISTAQTQLGKLRDTLSSGNITSVSPDQLNLLNQLSATLDKASEKLGTFDQAGKVTNQTLQQTETILRKANTAIKNSDMAAKQAAQGWNVLGKAITSVYIIRRVIQYLIQGYKEAIKFVETVNLFNVATKDSAEALGDFAQSMADAYNTDIGPILNAIAVFRQYANTMGIAGEQADILGENLTKLGVDLASLYNTTNEVMFNALKSGLAGLTKPLMRYGISVHKATLEQTALRLGVNKTWNEFTEAEKIALRYIAILEQTSSAQGDLARTLESPENQLKIAKAQLQVFIRNLGTLVTMVAKFVLPVFNGLMIAINSFISALSTAAGYEIPDYSDNLSENNQILTEGTEDAEEYADAMEGILAPLDEINQATPKDSNNLGEIDPKILEAIKGYDNLMDQIKTKTDAFAEIFSRIFNPKLFEGVGKILGTVFNAFGAGLEIVIQLLNILTPPLNTVLNLVGYILEGIATVLNVVLWPVIQWLDGVTSNIWTLIGAFVALNLVMAAANGSWKSMIAFKVGAWLVNVTKALIANTAAWIKNTAAKVANIAKTIASTIANWWENASLMAKIGLLTFGAGLVLVPIVLAAAGAFSSKANEVPAMATGGVVSDATLALIGEGKYNEAVVPLGNSPQFKTMKEDIAAEVLRNLSQTPTYRYGQHSAGSRVGGTAQPIILQLNGREVARGILPDMSYVQSQTGVKLK